MTPAMMMMLSTTLPISPPPSLLLRYWRLPVVAPLLCRQAAPLLGPLARILYPASPLMKASTGYLGTNAVVLERAPEPTGAQSSFEVVRGVWDRTPPMALTLHP